MTTFHKLTITALNKPITSATTITFDIPKRLQETFNYYPGQHLNIKFHINGKEARRSYSLNSCPFLDEPLQVTVKTVKGGLVSNYVNDQLKVGDVLEVMPPQGKFYADIQEDAYKSYFLFAAGSGITPIFSILTSALQAAPYSHIYLLYGNTNQDTIIFEKELENLQAQFPNRLTVVHILSNPKVWTTWKQWQGRKGRIDTETIEWFIENNPPIAQTTEYYICGPGAMNISVQKCLLDLGIPKELIHIEQFGGAVSTATSTIQAAKEATLTITLAGEKQTLVDNKGQTILQTLKEAKVDAPYSCESGVCGTCIAKVTKGKAKMKACMALDEEEIAQGYVLTCQAVPTTKEINLVFE